MADDHGAVVQGAVLEEDVFNQRVADVGVDNNTCRNDVVQVVFACQQDESALLDFRHVEAGFGDRIHIQVDVAPDFQELELPWQLAFLGLGTDGEEETPYLGLENDDKRDEAHADEGTEDGGQHLHLQILDHLPNEEDGHDTDEDAHGRGAFQETVEAKEQQGHQNDVDDVEDTELDEKVDHGLYFSAKLQGFSDTLTKSAD